VKREGFSPPPPLPPARLGGLPEPGVQAPQRARSGTPGALGARCDEMNIYVGKGVGNPHPLHFWFFPPRLPTGRKNPRGRKEGFFSGSFARPTGPSRSLHCGEEGPLRSSQVHPRFPPGEPQPYGGGIRQDRRRTPVARPLGSRASGTDEESGVRGPQGLPTQKPPLPPSGSFGPGSRPSPVFAARDGCLGRHPPAAMRRRGPEGIRFLRSQIQGLRIQFTDPIPRMKDRNR
jgi:hypothetical protein